MNHYPHQGIAQAKLATSVSPILNYKSVLDELRKHDDLYLDLPLSLDTTLKEIIHDTEQLNKTNNFDFNPVLAFAAKIEHLDPIDEHNKFKISEILTKVWRFVKHYNLMNKLLFYDTIASLSHPFNPTKIGATLMMFYVPHIKNMDPIYHKVYHPRF